MSPADASLASYEAEGGAQGDEVSSRRTSEEAWAGGRAAEDGVGGQLREGATDLRLGGDADAENDDAGETDGQELAHGKSPSGAAFGREPGRREAADDAVPGLEVLSDAAMKRVMRMTDVQAAAGAGLLAGLVAISAAWRVGGLARTLPVVTMNLAVGALDLAILTCCLAAFCARVWALRHAGQRWSPRRARWTTLFVVQLLCVYFGNMAFAAANAHVAMSGSGFFDDVVVYGAAARWLAWNTLLALFVIQARSYNLMVDGLGHPLGPREDGMYLDAPWRSHWFVGVYWMAFQACAGMITYCLKIHVESGEVVAGAEQCETHGAIHNYGPALVVLSIGYFGMFLYFMRRAFVLLAKKSYIQFRWANVSARLTFRLVGVVLFFGVLCFTMLWFLEASPCLGYVTSIMGFAPLQLALALFMAVNTAITMPVKPGSKKTIRTLPSTFFWLEEDAHKYKEQAQGKAGEDFRARFCFETAVKLIYWCEFMYQYDPRTRQAKVPYSLETGLSSYSLSSFEFMSAPENDAHAMIAWSKTGTIVVCFRGTKSTTNILSDLKFWRTPHPPTRGYFLLGTRPLVHKGFFDYWQCGGLVERILNKIKRVLADPEFDRTNLRILVSGHSLGGAVAVLASHDIRRYCGVESHQLSCYTFGAPRVGNHKYAAEVSELVPDTWHVINDLDVVPRVPKFWVMFKRSGDRVIINYKGDMIVSPIFLEFKLSSAVMGKINAAQHKLGSYRKSLSAVALVQFHKYKALPGGSDAIKVLFQKGHITEVLGVSSKTAHKLQHMASKIWKERTPCAVERRLEDRKLRRAHERIELENGEDGLVDDTEEDDLEDGLGEDEALSV